MSTPTPEFKNQAAAVTVVASQLMSQAGALWTTAAEKSDTLEGLGIDERINLLHNLVDVWVKGYASMLQAALASQKGAQAPLAPGRLTQTVSVEPADYARQVSAAGPFTRVGIDSRVIPVSSIAFEPPTLAAGATDFVFVVKDVDFVGSNYRGSVTLTPTPDTPLQDGKGGQRAPQTEAITVGL